MSNTPRHPVRPDSYDTNRTDYYPNEVMEANGSLYKMGTDGTVTELYGARLKALEDFKADMLYEKINITSFTHNAGTKEMGSTVTSVVLNWALNKNPKTLTLDGAAIGTSLRTQTLSNLNINMNNKPTWTLKATDERDASDTATTSITFYNGVYYGVASKPSAYDSAFILGLTKTLRGSKLTSFSANAGAGQYIYYALPTRMGQCNFKVGGFDGGFTLVGTVAFTNASGYTENYYVYESDNANLGSTAVTVS